MTTSEKNKLVVTRFNKAFIEGGDINVFNEIIHPGFINRTAPPGMPTGPEGVAYFFNHFLKPAFPDLTVEIQRQVAEGDLVTTHKIFYGTHQADFMGITATGKKVTMEIMDIIRLDNEKFLEHWNVVDWQHVIQQLNN